MNQPRPNIVVLAGPNGAGKTTASTHILRDTLAVDEFVNADVIARGLSGFAPEKAAMQAGRIMLARLDELAAAGGDFAFETTLASRTFAPWLRRQIARGYAFHLVYLWVPDAEMSIRRVAERVQKGGHFVPDDIVRRRHARGLRNFFELYRSIATTWRMYDSSVRPPRLVAERREDASEHVLDSKAWEVIQRQAHEAGDEA